MNRQIIDFYVDEYIKNIDSIHSQEVYKWKAVKQLQDNWNIDAEDFCGMLESALI